MVKSQTLFVIITSIFRSLFATFIVSCRFSSLWLPLLQHFIENF